MELTLNDLVTNMIKDVKSGKAARQEKKRKALLPKEKPPAPHNPWIDEAVTLLLNTYICDCGAEHTFPNPNIFIERTRLRHGHPELHQEAVHVSHITNTYAHLPHRTTTRTHHVHNCQRCFTPTSNPYASGQLSLHFPPTTTQEIH